MNAGTRVAEVSDFLENLELIDREGQLHSVPAKRIKFDYRHAQLPQSGVIVSGTFAFKKGEIEKIRQEVQDYQKRRRETQPLDKPNLGSVFKNPPKHFAAELIEEVGLKGVRVGGARISDKHANFIINEGDATAKDVLALIGLAKDKVKEVFDIHLDLEVKVMGRDLESSKE